MKDYERFAAQLFEKLPPADTAAGRALNDLVKTLPKIAAQGDDDPSAMIAGVLVVAGMMAVICTAVSHHEKGHNGVYGCVHCGTSALNTFVNAMNGSVAALVAANGVTEAKH